MRRPQTKKGKRVLLRNLVNPKPLTPKPLSGPVNSQSQDTGLPTELRVTERAGIVALTEAEFLEAQSIWLRGQG